MTAWELQTPSDVLLTSDTPPARSQGPPDTQVRGTSHGEAGPGLSAAREKTGTVSNIFAF